MKLLKRYDIKVPAAVKVLYFSDFNCIVFIGPIAKKTVKLRFKILFDNSNNTIKICNLQLMQIPKKSKFLLSEIGTLSATLKQAILESSILMSKKLKLIGVGYKVSSMEKESILLFKLGFSHSIFLKIPQKIKVLTFKSSNIYLFGNSLINVADLAARIRFYKSPEPYKGKGILYSNETITIKEGKKV